MTEITKETVTSTQASPSKQTVVTPIKIAATTSQTWEYVIYFLFGVLEIFLIFRLIFKIAGASQASYFIRMIYGVAGIFIIPFDGIFRKGFTQGIETTAIFEPSTLVAILVYAVLAWIIVSLVRVLSGEKQAE